MKKKKPTLDVVCLALEISRGLDITRSKLPLAKNFQHYLK